MADAAFARRISFNERLYLAEERRQPGFCIQLVIEGDGALDIDALRAAVAQAAEPNPGVRLVRRGVLGWMRWIAAGPVPPVREVRWTEGDPPAELERPLPPETGPTCEVVCAGPARLVFRCFHGVMDARGLLHFAEDVFRALRGAPLVGSDGAQSDTEFLIAEVGPRKRAAVPIDRAPIVDGGARQWPSRVLWHRLTIEGPAPTGLIARLAVAIAALAPDGHARLMVPVDVRNYRRGLRATGNLSYPLFLEVAAEQPWRDVQRTVLKGLKDKAPLHLDPAERIAPWLPLWFFAGFYRLWIATQQRRGRYPFTALLSQIALQATAPLDAPGFATRALFVLPMQSDIFPLTLAVATVAGRVDVVLSAPEALVDRAGLARLADAARAQLVSESVAAA